MAAAGSRNAHHEQHCARARATRICTSPLWGLMSRNKWVFNPRHHANARQRGAQLRTLRPPRGLMGGGQLAREQDSLPWGERPGRPSMMEQEPTRRPAGVHLNGIGDPTASPPTVARQRSLRARVVCTGAAARAVNHGSRAASIPPPAPRPRRSGASGAGPLARVERSAAAKARQGKGDHVRDTQAGRLVVCDGSSRLDGTGEGRAVRSWAEQGENEGGGVLWRSGSGVGEAGRWAGLDQGIEGVVKGGGRLLIGSQGNEAAVKWLQTKAAGELRGPGSGGGRAVGRAVG
ncbi:Protein of unknown function [Gryllus bimaculatus]|nr:Protein of unknown function [Gryllus bimaculatus]